MRNYSLNYSSKILALSLAWHALWFFSLDSVINPRGKIKGIEEAVFLGQLLTNLDLMPRNLQKDSRNSRNMVELSRLQDKIERNDFLKLINLTQKRPWVMKDNSLLPKNNISAYNKIGASLSNIQVRELNFNSAYNKASLYSSPKPTTEFCEFKVAVSKDNSILIERLSSTANPLLDIEIKRYLEKEVLNNLAQKGDSKIKVKILYYSPSP